ncbi:phage tail sheath family protein [Phocaeicola faecalis]|uniref:phage tail sheath family protein n=1 Tax=Phocaeicola faecalis TaxID=2786956 RepID=UPI001F17A125|nr:phage tail sheath C-terminal domain-containing protein [Phocaeicola faecalis]
MGNMKTPGVYIVEKNAFPNSVVEAETAIPAFIGITDKAQNGNDDLKGVPWKISSMTEYLQYFGGAPKLEFAVDIKKYFYLSEEQKKEGKTLTDALKEPAPGIFQYCIRPSGECGKVKFDEDKAGTEEDDKNGEETPVGYAFRVDGANPYTLYYNMQMFFANGGGTCYVVSVGNYGDDNKDTLNDKNVEAALAALEKIQEVTMIIVPEAVESNACANIQQLMMKHCGEMGNRFAILDVPSGAANTPLDKRMEAFQNTVTNYFSYGAAYFPWLNTSVLSERDLNSKMFNWKKGVYSNAKKLTVDPNLANIADAYYSNTIELTADENIKIVNGITFKLSSEIENGEVIKDGTLLYTISQYAEKKDDAKALISKTFTVIWPTPTNMNEFYAALSNSSPLFKQAIKAILKQLNLLPPSAAMAGIYTMVDRSRGVWKAPANVTLNYVNSPAEDIDDEGQAGLNAPMNGKAINVIRAFRGEGIKVWGARTLDGNSLDWRYINVRRTMLFLEESIRNAARAYVFEPNDAGTWINMKCMIENFLRSVWKRGGLAGATPEDAFEVHIGLGDTMTGDDILEGIMRITVLVAITHPAEFIEITFQQQMQKS